MQPHQVSTVGALGSGAITLADAFSGANWQTVAINAAFTLISAAFSAWLKSKQKGGGK